MPGRPKNPQKYQCLECKRYFSSLGHMIAHRCVQKKLNKNQRTKRPKKG